MKAYAGKAWWGALRQLSHELQTACDEGSVPERLSPAHLWITDEESLKVLPFAAFNAPPADSSAAPDNRSRQQEPEDIDAPDNSDNSDNSDDSDDSDTAAIGGLPAFGIVYAFLRAPNFAAGSGDLLRLVMIVLVIALVASALISRRRLLHDRLAGTYLVAR